MTLQTFVYWEAIVFMTVMLILIIAILVAVLVIRQKIVSLERAIADKLGAIGKVTGTAGAFFSAFRGFKGAKNRRRG